mmetsp:Transcript_3167/g.3514  ORF Transcript_3167/g.3514 Transcript_3167/m.3514 type:complete len:208 (-) Transcript_3167:2971-3594(-)
MHHTIVPTHDVRRRARGSVPQTHRLICTTRTNFLTIHTDPNRHHSTFMTFQCKKLNAGFRIPFFNGSIIPSRKHRRAIRCDIHAHHNTLVPPHDQNTLSGFNLPLAHGAIITAGVNVLSACIQPHRNHKTNVPTEYGPAGMTGRIQNLRNGNPTHTNTRTILRLGTRYTPKSHETQHGILQKSIDFRERFLLKLQTQPATHQLRQQK